MRYHHAIAVALVLVVGVAVKWFYFSTPTAVAEVAPTPPTLNLLQMHTDYPNMKELPVQDVKEPF